MADTETPDEETAEASQIPMPRAFPRAVLWLGLAAGTAVTVLAVMNGIRFPGLEIVLSVLVTWALLMVLAVTVAELLRRHHRALARHGWRHSKRGAAFAGHHTRRGAKAAGGYLTAKAAERWRNRQPQPVQVRRASDQAPQAREDIPDPAAPPSAKTVAAVKAKVCEMFADDDVEPFELTVNADGSVVLDRTRKDQWSQPVVVAWWHRPDTTTEPPASANAAGSPPPEGNTTMPDTRVVNGPQGQRSGSRRASSQTAGTVPAKWTPVIADATDLDPESDGDLLDWLGNEVNGVHAYAEALIAAYETCTNGIGLDPVATATLHDVADTITEAAISLALTRAKFADHYELPREFAGNGGVMPHDGRWVTGEGD